MGRPPFPTAALPAAPSNGAPPQPGGQRAWLGLRLWRALAASLRWRLLMVFVCLALAVGVTFLVGAQRAFGINWRSAALPLLSDYVDRLAAEIGTDPSPSVARAQALTERLPITVVIEGPLVNWRSHPDQDGGERADRAPGSGPPPDAGGHRDADDWDHHQRGGPQWLQRHSSDGHRIAFGINTDALERRPRLLLFTLGALLLLTLGAYLVVRHLLRPLDGIRSGAQRFGAGDFAEPIRVRRPERPDELGQLAATINTMGHDIQQMLDAKRALLLAISHELRSPLTRARLNTELLPENPEVDPQRQALLRDLQEMASLINDLLESERLASRHASLQREAVDLPALVAAVLAELAARHPGAAAPQVQLDPALPALWLDAARMRLLLRNLLDNALRHGAAAGVPAQLRVSVDPQRGGLVVEVRDHGPGVPEAQLAQLAQAFYRPDAARSRLGGAGVGLGLYLCRLVAEAHGGSLSLHNAQPGLRVRVWLPVGGAGQAP